MQEKKIKEEIYLKSHLPESSDLCRSYFKELDLDINSVTLEQAESLKTFIQNEMDILSDESYSTIKNLKMHPKILKKKSGIYLYADGSYFKKRQAVSFEPRSNLTISFCGWASGCNRIPFIMGFVKWCDWIRSIEQNKFNSAMNGMEKVNREYKPNLSGLESESNDEKESLEDDYDDYIRCALCGCEIYDHPTISFPVGSATCGCGCPLTAKHVYWMHIGKNIKNRKR